MPKDIGIKRKEVLTYKRLIPKSESISYIEKENLGPRVINTLWT